MTAAFPPPSLAAQVAELKRERQVRLTDYPVYVARGILGAHDAARRNQCLDAAIGSLSALAAPQIRERMREALKPYIEPNTHGVVDPDRLDEAVDAAIATLERLAKEGAS